MRLSRFLLPLCLTLGPQALADSIPHDSGFSGVELRWSTTGSTSVFYRLKEDQGRTLVCGFWFSEGMVPEANAERLLLHSGLLAGRRTVMRNLTHFTQITPDTPPERVRAACKPSEEAWSADLAAAAVKLAPPSGSFN